MSFYTQLFIRCDRCQKTAHYIIGSATPLAEHLTGFGYCVVGTEHLCQRCATIDTGLYACPSCDYEGQNARFPASVDSGESDEIIVSCPRCFATLIQYDMRQGNSQRLPLMERYRIKPTINQESKS